MAKERVKQGRVLVANPLIIGKQTFTLLNSEKLGRVMDWIEGTVKPSENEQPILDAALKLGAKEAVLALYDRLGGAIKLGERNVKIGTFFNFAEKIPVAKPNLSEDDYSDEYVRIPKKVGKAKKTESAAGRIRRLEAKTKKSE